jgi:hypothetical protein
MKRILAVLAIVAALAIPVAAQASAGPHHSHGQQRAAVGHRCGTL